MVRRGERSFVPLLATIGRLKMVVGLYTLRKAQIIIANKWRHYIDQRPHLLSGTRTHNLSTENHARKAGRTW